MGGGVVKLSHKLFNYFFLFIVSFLSEGIPFHFHFSYAENEVNENTPPPTIEEISRNLEEELNQSLEKSQSQLGDLEERWKSKSTTYTQTQTSQGSTTIDAFAIYRLSPLIRSEILEGLDLSVVRTVGKITSQIIDTSDPVEQDNIVFILNERNKQKSIELIQSLKRLLPEFSTLALEEKNKEFHLKRQYLSYFTNITQIFRRNHSVNLNSLGLECTTERTTPHLRQVRYGHRLPLTCRSKGIPFEWVFNREPYIDFSLCRRSSSPDQNSDQDFVCSSNTYFLLWLRSIMPKPIRFFDFLETRRKEELELKIEEALLMNFDSYPEGSTDNIKIIPYQIEKLYSVLKRFGFNTLIFSGHTSANSFLNMLLGQISLRMRFSAGSGEFWDFHKLRLFPISSSESIGRVSIDGHIRFLYFNDFKLDRTSSEVNHKLIQNGEMSFIGDQNFVFVINNSTGNKTLFINKDGVKEIEFEERFSAIETDIKILSEYLELKKEYVRNLKSLIDKVNHYNLQAKSRLTTNQIAREEFRVNHYCNTAEESEDMTIVASLSSNQFESLMSAIETSLSFGLKISDLDPLATSFINNLQDFTSEVLSKCIPKYRYHDGPEIDLDALRDIMIRQQQ